MEISLISTTLDQIETECLVVGVSEDHSVVGRSTELDKLTSDLIDSGDFKAKPGSQIILRNPHGLCAKRLILVGLGNLETFDALAQNDPFVSLGKALKGLPITQMTLDMESLTRGDQGTLERLGYGLVWAAYEYTTTKPKPVDDDAKLLTHVALLGSEADQAHLTTGMAIGHGANLTRELGNLPGNTCTPRYLADQAVHLSGRFSKLSCEVFDEDALEEIGMHCMLSVSRGSEEPARFIILNYQGATDPDSKPKVLVGKGVTFDTGGISLKPSAAMDEMKFDMCGAATVMGCMQSICEIGLEANVIGVIGAVENMPSGSATKPGDVVKTLAGKTVEILNTDAEGRLVLCDALTYVERFNPEAVVDIATLTGACLVALGRHNTGLLSTDDQLADELYTIGQETGDPCWRLPIEAPYQKLLDSNFADIANIGGRDAGTITAACFLSRFTENYRWAHLDIAGTAWFSGGKAKGASGRPVPLLVNWLRA
ncbi:MAG: Cytosol aminopeptidase [Gammaproteobacteria bacterium]|nr:MAG: Cytosol aminopeptidase [Gammaproteobacteria bacterium]